MADLPPYPGTPRWVKVSIIGMVVVLVVVILMLITGVGGHGRHDSDRHTSRAEEMGR